MAKGGGRQQPFGFSRRQRSDGFNNDPEREWNTRAYENMFDPNRDEDTGARFLELPQEIGEMRIKQEQDRLAEQDRQNASEAAQRPSPYAQEAPPLLYFKPQENTWAAHAQLVLDERNGIGFNPDQYIFDQVIASKLKNPALTDPSHRDYAKYEGLRTNIAVLRNMLIGSDYFAEGDKVNMWRLHGIAVALGDGMANDTWYKTLFTRPLSVDVANVEGVGAAEMYKYLQSIQTNEGLFQTLITNIRSQFGLPDRRWGLGNIDETPFSDANLSAPPPGGNQPQTGQSSPLPPVGPEQDATERMIALSEHLGNDVKKLNSPEALSEPERKQAVEEAHTILRWLRNLQFTDMDMQEWISQGTPPEQLAKAESLQKLVKIYTGQLHAAQQGNPNFVNNDPVIEDASNATGAIAMGVIEHTLGMLPPGHPDIARLTAVRGALPEQSDMLQEQSVGRLLTALEMGLQRASGQKVGDWSPAVRLAEISDRIHTTASKLRSIESLEEPAREESIERARIILEYFKNLRFNTDSLKKLADTGRPDDKVAVASKIEELVDTYKNLLYEAAEKKPDLLQDPLVKNANDAVSTFDHAVKLMAAKEMPNSIASAQQISALEAELDNNLEQHHLERAIKSMEGGMEKAVEELEMQQQQQQAEEQGREEAEASLHSSEHGHHGKKRRKKRRHGSAKGYKAQEKRRLALAADDYVLGQGRFADDSKAIRLDSKPGKPPKSEAKAMKQVAFMQGLNPEALEAVKKAGVDLHAIGKQVNSAAPLATVASNSAVAPDDKNFSTRNTDERERQQKNPTGPRV